MGDERGEKQQLKHLGFVRSASLLLLAWMSKLYEFVNKQLPLASMVTPFERMFNHAYKMFKAISYEYLLFADNKVDKGVQIFEKYAPSFVKKITSLVIWCIKTVMKLCQKARKGGLRAVMIYVTLQVTLFIMSQCMKLLGKLGYLPKIPLLADFSDQLLKLSQLPMAGQLVGNVTDVVGDAAKKGLELAEDVTDAVGDVAKKGFELAEDVTDAVGDVAKKGLGFGQSVAEDVTGTVEDISKKGLGIGQSAAENLTGTVENISKTGLGFGQSAAENVTDTVEDMAKKSLNFLPFLSPEKKNRPSK